MCLSRGERFKDARVLYNQHGNQTMKEVKDATGVNQSTIQALEDDEITRSVGYEKVVALAEHYGVSLNWLLGLSSEDPYLKPTSVDELRLSSSVIRKIKKMEDPYSIKGLNLLLDESLDSPELYLLICILKELIDKRQESIPEDFCHEMLSDDENYIFKNYDDPNTKEVIIGAALHRELMKKYPNFVGYFDVVFGNELLSIRINEICDLFKETIENLSGYTSLVESSRR